MQRHTRAAVAQKHLLAWVTDPKQQWYSDDEVKDAIRRRLEHKARKKLKR